MASSSGSSGPPSINRADSRAYPSGGNDTPQRGSAVWGKSSVGPVGPQALSSQLAASRSNPDIAEGSEPDGARLSDRAPLDASELSSYRKLGSVEFEVAGKLDEGLQKDLLEDAVGQSDLNADQQQAARENINQGFSFIGFLKKHAAKIAGVTAIITIGIVGFFIPGVGPVITTVCIVTLVGIATVLIFDDNTALIQPDKEETNTSADQTEPKKSSQSTEPDDKNAASTPPRAQPPTHERLKETDRLKEIDRSQFHQGSSKPDGQGGGDEKGSRQPIPGWNHQPHEVNQGVNFGPRSRGPSVERAEEGDGQGAPPQPSLKGSGQPHYRPDRPDGQGPDGEKRNRQPIPDWQHKRYQPNLSDADPKRDPGSFTDWEHHPHEVNQGINFGPRSRGPSVERAEEGDRRGATQPPSLKGSGWPQDRPDGQGPDGEKRNRQPIPDWQHKRYQPNLSDADPKRDPESFTDWEHHPHEVNQGVNFGPRSRGPSVERADEEGDGREAPPPPSLKGSGRPQHRPDRPDGQGPDGEKRNRQPILDWQHKRYQPNLSDADPKRDPGSFTDWEHHPHEVNQGINFGPRSRGPSVERAEEGDRRGATQPPSLKGSGWPQDRPDGQGPDGEKRNRQPVRDWQHKPYQPNLRDADPKRDPESFTDWEHHPHEVNQGVNFGPRSRGPSGETDEEGDTSKAPLPPSLKQTGGSQRRQERPDGQGLDEELKPNSMDEIDDDIQELRGLLDDMESQQDLGYLSDPDELTLPAEEHRQEEEYSDYGSEYGDDGRVDLNLQIHKAAQSKTDELRQDGFQHRSLVTPSQSDLDQKKEVLTEFQKAIFEHGMKSPTFAASLKEKNKDGTFLGQREICQIARKEILKRNKGMVVADIDNWSEVWKALNDKDLY